MNEKETQNIDNIFPNLPDEIKELNRLLLDVKWDNLDFDSSYFQEGIYPDNQILNTDQIRLIQAILDNIPEWNRIIACKQHYTHDYCLDIHTLSVLKKIRGFNRFNTLDDYKKLILLYSALLHDIEKYENEVDPEHPNRGAKKASSILFRLGFDEKFINSVYLLINHHQVLGLLAAGRISFSPEQLIEIFKDAELLDLQIILSIADIKSVKKNESFMGKGMEEKLEQIIQNIKEVINTKEIK